MVKLALGSQLHSYDLEIMSRERMVYRMLIAQTLVLLPVALGYSDGPIVIFCTEQVISDITYSAKSTASVEQCLKASRNTRPHFYTCTVT